MRTQGRLQVFTRRAKQTEQAFPPSAPNPDFDSSRGTTSVNSANQRAPCASPDPRAASGPLASSPANR